MEHWFRVNIVNDAGKPSSATVDKRLTKTYMLIVHKEKNPSEDEMRAELARIAKDEKIKGEVINNTYKFNEYLLSKIEKYSLGRKEGKAV